MTVLVAVHNGADYLVEAIQSILDQTYQDFELLVIEDGSTDHTLERLRSFADERLRVIQNEQNLGLIRSLNRGLEASNGALIARMDADDICLPSRLQKQVSFLQKNPRVDVVGSNVERFQGDRKRSNTFLPNCPDSVDWRMRFSCCLYHPTIVARREFFERAGGYDPSFPHAEDWALWLSQLDTSRYAVLPDVLLRYRVHGNSVGSKSAAIQRVSTIKALQMSASRLLGYDLCIEEAATLLDTHEFESWESAVRSIDLVQEMEQAFMAGREMAPEALRFVQDDTTLRLAHRAVKATMLAPSKLHPWKALARRRSLHVPGFWSFAGKHAWRAGVEAAGRVARHGK